MSDFTTCLKVVLTCDNEKNENLNIILGSGGNRGGYDIECDIDQGGGLTPPWMDDTSDT